MLATPWPAPFSDPDWRFELKWDGVRAIGSIDGAALKLLSRRGNDVTDRYPEIRAAPAARPFVLDGEIVALDASGRASFQKLQSRMNLSSPLLAAAAAGTTPVTYVVFDLLFDGIDITDEPWERRRERLHTVALPEATTVSEVYEDADPLWRFVTERGIEGIVAKRLGSRYRPGKRSPDWRKIAAFKTLRAVVGGFTAGESGRANTFGSLVLGLWQQHELRPIGTVGSGFDEPSLVAIRAALDQMIADVSPFTEPGPMRARSLQWTPVQPRLVAVVQYREWTSAGRLRAPSFKGFSDDPVETVTWEAEGPGRR